MRFILCEKYHFHMLWRFLFVVSYYRVIPLLVFCSFTCLTFDLLRWTTYISWLWNKWLICVVLYCIAESLICYYMSSQQQRLRGMQMGSFQNVIKKSLLAYFDLSLGNHASVLNLAYIIDGDPSSFREKLPLSISVSHLHLKQMQDWHIVV